MDKLEAVFRENQRHRYQEWLQAVQTWVFGDSEVAGQIGPYLILVHSSQRNPEKYLLPRLRDVRYYGGFIQGHGSARGIYQETEIWLLHHPMGCTATQMWFECLRGTGVRYLIGLGEMTAYPDTVHVGDIVLPTAAVRGDLITNYHAPQDIPAACDLDLLDRMQAKLECKDWRVHSGPVYSGMPGGIGVMNPILREKVWNHLQSGMLGNAMETSVTYLESARLGIKALDAWSVSDDIACGLWDDAPDGWGRWANAWDLIAWAALETLSEVAADRMHL